MRTIYYKNTWTVSSPYSDTPIMDIKVSNNLSTSIHCYTDDAGLEIKTQYVFVDPATGEEFAEADYDTATMAADTLQVFNYQYKVDYLRVIIVSSGTAGTLVVTGNVAQS